MICKKCGIAGDMVAEARSFDDTKFLSVKGIIPLVPVKETIRSVAYLYHGLCKGKDHCDCAHKIDFEGKVIRNGQKAGQSSGEDRESVGEASRGN